MGLRPTHRDENRIKPRAFTIELAWNGKDRGYSGSVEADDEFGLGCVFAQVVYGHFYFSKCEALLRVAAAADLSALAFSVA
jgi:hypothetical protein